MTKTATLCPMHEGSREHVRGRVLLHGRGVRKEEDRGASEDKERGRQGARPTRSAAQGPTINDQGAGQGARPASFASNVPVPVEEKRLRWDFGLGVW
jgi:hypothetical protein